MSGFSAEEQVLVIRHSDIFPTPPWQGMRTQDLDPYFEAISTHALFMPRAQVENDPTYQQIIPYVVFRHQGRYFVTHRKTAGSDARIHHLYSLGVGGHLNPIDGASNVLADGMQREWEEEVDYQGTFTPRLLGLLNDDSDPVSSVHLGIIFLVEGDTDEISIRETAKLSGEMLTLDTLSNLGDALETWAQIVLEHLRSLDAPDLA